MNNYERYGDYLPAEEAGAGSELGSVLTWVLVGFGAGALLSLLLAPRAGRETRAWIRQGYDRARRRSNELVRGAKVMPFRKHQA